MLPNKKILQDIIPSKRRSIRSIPLRVSKTEFVEEKVSIKNIEIDDSIEEKQKRVGTKRKKNYTSFSSSKFIISFIIIFLSISTIGIALSLLYTKGIVTITPFNLDLNVDGNFTVKKDVTTADQLKYEVVTVSGNAHKIVPAIDGPLVETKAKGTILLFNNTSSTQKLVAGTKLSNTTGLIYRTASTVTIPAKKSTTAGSVSVAVTGDKVGINYNTSLTDLNGDFKIVEFKGTTKYTSMYGRLKTDIIGGFSGYKKIISPEVQAQTEKNLHDELKANLLAKATPIIPKDYIMFDDAYIIDYKTSESKSFATGTVDISVDATLSGLIFNKTLLLKTIASKELKLFPAETYNIKGLENLKFIINNAKDFSIKKETPMIFSLKGPISLLGTFPEESLKKQLMGIKVTDSNTVFKNYASISNAYARITPFWMRSFPDSTERIIIEYKYK